jgi:hypothetical protein
LPGKFIDFETFAAFASLTIDGRPPSSQPPSKDDRNMQTKQINQIVAEIISDISKKDTTKMEDPESCPMPGIENVVEELLDEDDETSREVMRAIWKELQEKRCGKH